jgi:signal transduction histidine kinase
MTGNDLAAPGEARDVFRWLSRSPVPVLALGILLALLVAIFVINLLMAPSLGEVVQLVRTLTFTAVLSLGIGFVLYRRGWTRSPTLGLTLVLAYLWGAGLTLFNVWMMARLMFASEHDLTLALVLLIFAAIIATTFGIFVAASVTQSLRGLADVARDVADGDLSARAPVAGRDELARTAKAFNEMAEQLEQAAVQREELEAMRRELIAWVSHDLRTPLTGIRAMVEALRDGVVTDRETVHRYYSTIRGDVLGLNGLIDEMFELAQLDAGMTLDREAHALSDLISDALESFRALAAESVIALNGTVAEDVDPVPLDAARISRVLGNLIGNAFKHTPAGGRIDVSALRQGGRVRVSVADTGPGFLPEDLDRIFEKFYRWEHARSRATGGAGLGLAIAARVVEAHGGRIWAENRTEGGAEVTFELPA